MKEKKTIKQVEAIYLQSINDLIYQSHSIHRHHHDPNTIQKSTLLSIRTGACPEDCGYCAQSSKYKTGLQSEKLMSKERVLCEAKSAKRRGSTRFCMGSSGTRIRDNKEFYSILEMIKEVKSLGMETCVTLGMVTLEQANRLKEAGLDYYNHNIDTSREHYSKVVTTRSFDERLETLYNIRSANIHTCTGGILGMGEKQCDRISFLYELYSLPTHPASVTINRLIPIPGTPMADEKPISGLEIVRTIATARILMPQSAIRLSSGRESMSEELHALCFFSGVNSIFSGDKLLTTNNSDRSRDRQIFSNLGLKEKIY